MCFHSKQSTNAQTLQNRFNATFANPKEFLPTNLYNGFNFPKTPIITNQNPNTIQLFNWGLLPNWATNTDFRKNTLNAKIETINQKPSFKNVVNNTCIILIDGFYEWQWLDSKGKYKQKYLITTPLNQPFAVAGLFNIWQNQTTQIHTYTMLTTVANKLMSEIHNTKKRMPFILSQPEEQAWLNNTQLSANRNVELIATKEIETTNTQLSLF